MTLPDYFDQAMSFSPDGSQLAVGNRNQHVIQVWDLRAIRQRLSDMQLDWDLPPYPPAAPTEHLKPLQVTVLAGDLQREK